MSENSQPKFAFGQHVHVAGYWPRIFQVDGFRRKEYFYPDEQWSELVYELHDVETAEWLEADEEDLTPAGKSKPQTTRIFIDLSQLIKGGEEMAKEPRKLTARELSAREAEERKMLRRLHGEVIDELLDELNDYRALEEAFGDAEYGDRVMAIEAELKKLTEKD